MFVAIRHDAQEAVGPFSTEGEGISYANARRQEDDARFYIRPIIQENTL